MSRHRDRDGCHVALALEADGMVIGEFRDNRLQSVDRIPLPAEIAHDGLVLQPGRLGAVIRRAIRARGWRVKEAIVVVGGQSVLSKTVQLPPMPPEDRPAAVRSQIEPYVIFGGDEIVVAVERHPSANPGRALLMAAAPRSRVLPLAQAVVAAGVEIARIEPRALALWRLVTRHWAAESIAPETDKVQAAILADDDGIILALRRGLRTDLLHRIDLPPGADGDQAKMVVVVRAALEAGLSHLTGGEDASLELQDAGLMLPGAGELRAELATHFPTTRFVTPAEVIASLAGIDTDDPLAVLTVAGLTTDEGDQADVPPIDLVPAELGRRRALFDELRLVAGSCAMIWVFMLLLSLGLGVWTAREADRAEIYQQQLGGPLGNLRRLERIESEVGLNLDHLQTLSEVVHALPEPRSRKLALLASCVPPGLAIQQLQLRPMWLQVSGQAVDDAAVMELMHGLRELKARGEIGDIEVGNMHRDPSGRVPHTEFQIRLQQFPAATRADVEGDV